MSFGALALFIALVSAAGATLVSVKRSSAVPDEPPSQESRVARLADGTTSSTQTVNVSAGSLTQMMEEDVVANQEYLQALRRRSGGEAAARAEASIRGPYAQRLREIAAAGKDATSISAQVITVGGRFSFSSVSFDGALNPKDPVSVLFVGKIGLDGIYSRLTSSGDCGGQACPAPLLDQDGPLGEGGIRVCHSQTQWVLMGSTGGALEWRRNSKGLMGQDGGCASGTRDHVRLFAGQQDNEFGSWVLATPHREEWVNGAHVIRSWQQPVKTFLDTWSVRAAPSDAPQNRPFFCEVKTDGLYQGVAFDGRLAVVPVQ